MKNFEQHLMDKYPELFYSEEGSLTCPCGVWVPQGWENIVDNLCGSIVNYTKHTYRSAFDVISKKYYFWEYIVKIIDRSHLCFIKVFPKYNKWEFNKPYFAFVQKIRDKASKYRKYRKVYPPGIKIDQIKEKFGTLRFYFSGGDEQITGMVRFAEYLSDQTCEITGKKGQMCSSAGGWMKTLSTEEALKIGYKPINERITKES